MEIIPTNSIKKYDPYLNKHWPEHVDKLIPLLEDNIARSQYWAKTELESVRNDYKKLRTVPITRRLSITQQDSIRPKSLRNFIKENKSTRRVYNTKKKMKNISHRKYAHSIKHIKHTR
jgi:hypothetical protein